PAPTSAEGDGMTDDMWGTGDYPAVAEKGTSIADVLGLRADIESGMTVLDVACGTGNATIAAAQLGAGHRPGLLAGSGHSSARTRTRGQRRGRVARRRCTVASIRR